MIKFKISNNEKAWAKEVERFLKYCIDVAKKNKARNETYYRFTYKGVGIYQAYKNNVNWKHWKEFLEDDYICRWLPKPKEYLDGYESYFTELGYFMFISRTLPIMEKRLNPRFIKIDRYDAREIKNRIIYRDGYQIITDKRITCEYKCSRCLVSNKRCESGVRECKRLSRNSFSQKFFENFREF